MSPIPDWNRVEGDSSSSTSSSAPMPLDIAGGISSDGSDIVGYYVDAPIRTTNHPAYPIDGNLRIEGESWGRCTYTEYWTNTYSVSELIDALVEEEIIENPAATGVYPTRESLIEMAREWLYEDPWASRNNGDTGYDDYDEDDYQINDYQIERS